MPEINRPDLVTDEAYKVFKDLKADVVDLKSSLDEIRSSSKSFSDAISNGNTTSSQLKETVQGLSTEQKALLQVQNQIAVQVAKQSDAYQTQLAILKDHQAQLKQKIELGNKEAISVTAQNSSINQLNSALQINRQAYANLTTEQQRQSAQGQQLLKVINDQDKSFKSLQQSIGKNQAEAGNYKIATEGLSKEFESLLGKLGPAGEKIETIGGKALNAAGLVKGLATGFTGLIAAVAAFAAVSIEAYFTRTSEGAKELFIATSNLEFKYNQFKDVLADVGRGLVKWLELSPAVQAAQALLSNENDEQAKGFEKNALKGRQLIRDRIALTLEEAKLELEKNELLFNARNKLQFTDEERLKFNREAYAIQIKISDDAVAQAKAELTFRTKEILLLNQQRQITNLSATDLKELTELQIKVIDAEKIKFEGTRRIQAQEIQLVEEKIKKILDAQKAEYESQSKFNEETIKADQAKNNRIIANQSSTLEEKTQAEINNAKNLISLNDKSTADELRAIRQSALERIQLDQKTNEAIIAKAGDNLKLRAQLIIEAKDNQLKITQAFESQQQLIIEAGAKKEEEIRKQAADNIVKITIDLHKKLADAELANSSISKDHALIALNKSLENREISLHEYEIRKRQIETQSKNNELEIQNEQLQNDLDYFKTTKDLEEKHANDILAIEKKIADNKLSIQENADRILIERKKKIHDLEKQLANSVLDTISTVSKNETDSKTQALEDQLSALQNNEQKQLALAGNNEAAKAQITMRFANEQAKIKKEEAKLKHDEAIKEKRLAEAKIIINTAVAISEVLPNIVAAALIGALGALELVKVESTPIPAYFKGTENHPGGPAMVGEQGIELIKTPSDGLLLSPSKATLIDLPAGSEVIPNPETMRRLAMAGMNQSANERIASNFNNELLNEVRGLKEITSKNKPKNIRYSRVGAMVYVAMGEKGKYMNRIRGLSMGKWI